MQASMKSICYRRKKFCFFYIAKYAFFQATAEKKSLVCIDSITYEILGEMMFKKYQELLIILALITLFETKVER